MDECILCGKEMNGCKCDEILGDRIYHKGMYSIEREEIHKPMSQSELEGFAQEIANCCFGIDDLEKQYPEAWRKSIARFASAFGLENGGQKNEQANKRG